MGTVTDVLDESSHRALTVMASCANNRPVADTAANIVTNVNRDSVIILRDTSREYVLTSANVQKT